MGYACHSEFGNREVHLFGSHLHGLVHIVDTEMFADEAKKVFGPAGDDDLTAFLIHKPYRVPDEITPGACAGTQKQGVVLSFLHLMDHIHFGICHKVSVDIEILVVKRDEFKEDM